MERKTSLLIGPRTRQNILKGKVVRKLEDGCDNFEDYWTDSDGESSTLSKSSIRSSEMPNVESSNSDNASHVRKTRYTSLKSKAVHSPLKSKAVHPPLKSKSAHSPLKSKSAHSPLKSESAHSPLKSKAVHSSLTSKAVHSPLKSKAVHSPLKSKAVHSPLKSKAVHSPLKSKAVHSPLKSKAVHSPLKSKAVHSPLKSKAVHSPLKSKAVHSPLKSKAVHSPLKSKAVHSPLKSKAVHSPLKSKAVHSPLKSKAVHSPLKSKAVHSPLKSKAVHSPLKSKAVHSPLKSKAVHSPLKSKAVHSPLKSKAVHSPLKSKAVHSPLKSKAVHSPLKSKAVHSPLKSKAVHSPLKSKAVHSPLKSKAVHSPLKSKAVHSPLKSKAVHSPLKSKRVLYNDTVNADGIVNVNKETSAIEFQDITVNLGVDENNLGSEALNEALANIARNKLPKVSSGEIQEIHNANNSPLSCISNAAECQEIHNINYSPLSCTYNKKSDLLVSKISFKSSKKSISRSTKKDAKIKELQLQYDEYDEKIMQMINMNDDENERISNSSQEEMALAKENSYFMGERKEKSKVKKQTTKVSRNIQSKENFADESPNESIDRNSKSLNQNINDSESLSFENIQMKKTEDTSKHKKNKFSKKNLTVDSSHTADISVNSHADLSHFESDIDAGETQADKQAAVSKNSLPDNHLNTHMNFPRSTMDVINSDTDSPSKNTRRQKKNNIDDLSYSESDIDTGEMQTDKQAAVSKNSLPDNHFNTHMNSPGNTSDVINSDTDSPSKNTRKHAKINVQKTSIFADQHSSKNVMTQKSLPSSPDNNSYLKKSKLHKNDARCQSKVAVEINDSDNDNIDDVSKSASEDTSSNMDNNNISEVCMIEKEKTTSNKTDFIPDENNLDATSFNESSHFQTLKRRKTFVNKSSSSIPEGNDVANTSVSFSEDSVDVSKVNMEKPAKKMKTNKNDKNRQSEKKRKSYFIPHEDIIETADVDSSSKRQTSTRRKTRNRSVSKENDVANTSMSFSQKPVSVSEVNIEKPAKKMKTNENDKNRQNQTNRKSYFIPHEDIIETADVDSSSERQTSTRQKTRNRSVSEENDVANTSMNFSEKPVSVSKVNMEKTTKKQGKDKSIKRRQKETNKNSYFTPHEDIVETADLDSYSQSQTSKRRRTRKSSITEENDFVNMPLNYPKNSVNCFEGINHKKTKNKQRKFQKYKSRQKSASNKSDFVLDKDILKKDDLSLSQLQTLENSSHQNSVNIKKIAKKQRKSKNSKSHDIQKTPDSSQQQTKRQKTSVSVRNNFISEENDQANASINSSENSSVNNFSVIAKKKTPKKQKKVEIDKSRPLHDESDIEGKNQSKVRASNKSKSNVTKNNVNKENEKSNHATIRRSVRERFAPLAHWRNERLCYGFRNGYVETFGVDKGTNEDAGFLKSLFKNTQKNKQKIKKPNPIEIFDVAENKKKRVHLLQKFPLVPWDSPLRCKTNENSSHAFLIKRMLETKKNSFGYIHIDVNKTKPPQYMPEEDLLLTAIEGRVEIHLYDKVYILEKKDMFIVPRGTAYNITNISKKRALLSYVVGKFKYLEDF